MLFQLYTNFYYLEDLATAYNTSKMKICWELLSLKSTDKVPFRLVLRKRQRVDYRLVDGNLGDSADDVKFAQQVTSSQLLDGIFIALPPDQRCASAKQSAGGAISCATTGLYRKTSHHLSRAEAE